MSVKGESLGGISIEGYKNCIFRVMDPQKSVGKSGESGAKEV
jgi:hypothetical protein